MYTALLKFIFLKICVILNSYRHEQCLVTLLKEKREINQNFLHSLMNNFYTASCL